MWFAMLPSPFSRHFRSLFSNKYLHFKFHSNFLSSILKFSSSWLLIIFFGFLKIVLYFSQTSRFSEIILVCFCHFSHITLIHKTFPYFVFLHEIFSQSETFSQCPLAHSAATFAPYFPTNFYISNFTLIFFQVLWNFPRDNYW